jgi:hypothetical protein
VSVLRDITCKENRKNTGLEHLKNCRKNGVGGSRRAQSEVAEEDQDMGDRVDGVTGAKRRQDFRGRE